jgi:hypothetical protein
MCPVTPLCNIRQPIYANSRPDRIQCLSPSRISCLGRMQNRLPRRRTRRRHRLRKRAQRLPHHRRRRLRLLDRHLFRNLLPRGILRHEIQLRLIPPSRRHPNHPCLTPRLPPRPLHKAQRDVTRCPGEWARKDVRFRSTNRCEITQVLYLLVL